MKYIVEIFDGRGSFSVFLSASRNARKHLRDSISPSSAAKCVVYSSNGEKVISACAYQEDGTIKYIDW